MEYFSASASGTGSWPRERFPSSAWTWRLGWSTMSAVPRGHSVHPRGHSVHPRGHSGHLRGHNTLCSWLSIFINIISSVRKRICKYINTNCENKFEI